MPEVIEYDHNECWFQSLCRSYWEPQTYYQAELYGIRSANIEG